MHNIQYNSLFFIIFASYSLYTYKIKVNLNMNNPITLLDAFDARILQLLEEDGRKPFSAIAHEIGISNTMVHQRVNKLLENGILKGIKPIIDEKKIGYDWAAYTGLTLEKDYDSEKTIEALRLIPEVTECYYITGAYTLFIRIIARNHEHMRHLLYEKIDNIPGISKTDSIMELGCAFRRNVGL
jgi:Lrp/AsnC family transcriptional regulator for asnA, asnC and gidA